MKKIALWAGIIIILLVIVGVVFGKNLFPSNEGEHVTEDVSDASRSPIEKSNEKPNEEKPKDISQLIQDIWQDAKEGKLPDVSAVSGKTDIDTILSEWGEPENTTEARDGTYIDYPEGVTFGYEGNIVFDLRSFNKELQTIHYQDIIDLKGAPDEERYYKDDQVDQIILVYQLNDTYQLKWILPRPSDADQNPAVHHISVYMDPAGLAIQESGLLESMTLDEKIGQMIMAGFEGTTTTPELINLIEDYKVGGIIFFGKNLSSYSQSLDLVNGIKKVNAENKIPVFLSVDQEGGRVTRLPGLNKIPTNKEIGNRNDPDFSYQMGTILANELKAYGMNMNFAPVMDVNSNPNNPVIGDRSFGDDPDLVSRLGIQTMNGMEDEQIIPVIKHFPGHGDTAVDSHLALPRIDKSLKELNQMELIPFKAAIQQGADVVMVAHILFPQLDTTYPSSMSKPIMTDLLRGNLGYNGVIITDDMMMDAIKANYETGEAAVQSVKAGSDILLISRQYEDIIQTFEALKQAVQRGEISEERIDASVERILALKKKYDINDKEVSYQDLQGINTQIEELVN